MPTKPGHISPDRARELNRLRVNPSGGRNGGGGKPITPRTCLLCGATMSTTELRRHPPRCPARSGAASAKTSTTPSPNG